MSIERHIEAIMKITFEILNIIIEILKKHICNIDNFYVLLEVNVTWISSYAEYE